MTQARVPGLSADVQQRAHLTDRQAECLALRLNGGSWRFIARVVGINFSTVIDHVNSALVKIEKALSDELAPAHEPRARPAGKERRRVVGVDPFQ